ncbi:MAG: hypothetical protein KDD35_08680, partial [Bdellovibrionales bacterium]|nr:hypothetical protein [Bdellovibrionales bacterium]
MRSLLLAQFAVALFLNAQEALSAGPTTCRSTMSPPIVLNSLKEIWNTIKLTSVSENREMLRKNLGELNSEYLKMLDAGEVWIELHGKKIANEIKTRKLSKIGGLDILVVGAGPHAANFAAGAMDIYRRRAQIDKNITPPKMLLVGKDGVAPSFRKYSSPLVSPVVWRRDYSMNYSMGQDPFPFPGSPFSTADLLGFIDSKNPPSPWHSHLASQHPQIPPTSEGGLVFLDSNRIYEQTVLTIAQAQVPFLDETSLVSFSWHDDMRLIEARTKNGISIFAKALVIATGPGSPIVPFDDQKSQRTFKLASEMFNSGQMRLSLGTSEDFYLALQREGPSFINQFRKEKSLIIGASDAGKALIETLFGALELRDGGRPLNEDLPDPTFVW